jgi:hypothetical protein
MPPVTIDDYKDACRHRLMAALLGIVHGVGTMDEDGHPTLVPFLESRRKTTIFGALAEAAQVLNEQFDENELCIADRACGKIGVRRTTDRKDQVAREILTALVRSQST